ncbi:hypothetical protein BGX23_012502 [Mortierella sp. AD031]|nr:hypothetical protein BGX23_012502 [Mortierella sp. AD031]
MTGTPTQPTLFAYFPLLKHWTVNEPGHSNVPQVDVDASLLRREITRHCPFLKSVQMGRVNGSNGAKLLVGVLVGLERFVMCPAELTSDVLGILKHQETLTHVELVYRSRSNDATGYAAARLNLIPRSCRQLRLLSIIGYSIGIGYAVGIEELEEGELVCKDLGELRLDVQELSNKSEIDACITRLQAHKNNRFRQEAIQDEEGQTVADRVIRRLLPLDHLKVVCLGTKDYYLASL